jgi:nucleoside-diphosphate kinase
MERTLLIIKPDAVERGLIGEIIARLERAEFAIRGMRSVHLTAEQAQQFYAEHEGKEFFERLVAFMTSGMVVVVAAERDGAIQRARNLVGATDPADAAPGSIRGDLGRDNTANTIHASDSPESAERELGFFFPELV